MLRKLWRTGLTTSRIAGRSEGGLDERRSEARLVDLNPGTERRPPSFPKAPLLFRRRSKSPTDPSPHLRLEDFRRA
jgi:hypothetical protein